ncbi:hypothetical protein MHYP_G00258680 [Metynnis hypsauchen]
MMPFTTVENVGFRKMMSVIDPKYELPGRRYFSHTAIPKLYGEVRERVEEQLKSASYFATTADLWSKTVNQDKQVDRAVGFCKKVVAAFSFSWKKKRDLAAAQEEYNLPKHKFVSETPTRWGSHQQMVKRVLEQKRAITEVLSKDKKTRSLVPTWQDVDILESIDAALSPLLEFTDALSGESYVSVSFLKPVCLTWHVLLTQDSSFSTLRRRREIHQRQSHVGDAEGRESCCGKGRRVQ